MTLAVRFRPTTMPSAIAEVMRSVLISSDTILHLPEPTVQVVSLDGNAVELELSFRVGEIGAAARARSEIFDLIYRHAKAAGLALSSPPNVGGPAIAASETDEPRFGQHTTPRRLLDAIALFASLTDEREGCACRNDGAPHLPQGRGAGRAGGGAQVADDRQKRRGRGDLPR